MTLVCAGAGVPLYNSAPAVFWSPNNIHHKADFTFLAFFSTDTP